MSKSFKYQWLIQEKGIKQPCPAKECKEVAFEAFRWGHFPKESKLNFLPNFLYNEENSGKPMRFNIGEDLKNCGNCSLSMFPTLEESSEYWFNVIPQRTRSLLKYTHILRGELNTEMGVATSDRPHFEFFEYEGVELRNSFEVLCELKKL